MFSFVKNVNVKSGLLFFLISTLLSIKVTGVLYTDDYLFFALSHIDSYYNVLSALFNSNSPAYSVYSIYYFFSWIANIINPISYFYVLSIINIFLTLSALFVTFKSLKVRHSVFLSLIVFCFLLFDTSSNQNIFWSFLAINSSIQHLLSFNILVIWLFSRNYFANKKRQFYDLVVCILLFGFPAEIILTTFIFIIIFLFLERRFYLYFILFFGCFILALNLYSKGAKNRSKLLIQPDSINEIFNRLIKFLDFIIHENISRLVILLVISIFIGFFLKISFSNFAVVKVFIVLVVHLISLAFITSFAYMSVYHFVGFNLLITILVFLTGIKVGIYLARVGFLVFNLFLVSCACFIMYFNFIPTLLLNLNYMEFESSRFKYYFHNSLLRPEVSGSYVPFNFRDSSGLSFIGPNIPAWQTFNPVVWDFTLNGVEASIDIIVQNWPASTNPR